MIFKLGELFCGPSSLAWGTTHADIGNPDFKITHAWANDYDENTCKTYRRNICPDNKESVPKQIGMAVPCQRAKIIFEAILKTFAGIPYESMEANIEE